jgi:hypothetical protein
MQSRLSSCQIIYAPCYTIFILAHGLRLDGSSALVQFIIIYTFYATVGERHY